MIGLNTDAAVSFAGVINVEAAFTAERIAMAMPMSGWTRLPDDMERELPRLREAGQKIAESSDALVVIGAGGSSLGARALIEALPPRGVREVYFAGDNLSGSYMSRLVSRLANRDFSVIATSKSGTTTEPAAALRVLLKLLRERYGAQLSDRLYIVAGDGGSALRSFAETSGAGLFGIPESVGGRYSVLTAAGLLPAAARGLDIAEILRGAREESQHGTVTALRYAAVRQSLYSAGYRTEIFASFEPDARSLGEWWKQLFGESEGKHSGGIFPASVSFTGDLHSMGQYIQEGRRDIFETIVSFGESAVGAVIPDNSEFDDGFQFLDGRRFDAVNETARDAVKAAHLAGGVPVMELTVPGATEASLGALMFFFEYACAVSAIIGGVANPFDQPGVEAYKRIMLDTLKNFAH
ncbi:MAG: glucose-6-phosphate isomerase [Oscillospiraceae bacterium]|jgi:glucose-6-phosphate isomerase|nr:glucose-6-phosphate isomerase [Oscillospiraceae bacterium]